MTEILSKVLVDTSVFVDFFRGKEVPSFEGLLVNNRILLSPFVRLEILQGVTRDQVKKIEYVLGGIAPLPLEEELFERAEALLLKVRGHGLTLGIVDLLIAAQAVLTDCPVYSFDRVFHKLSQWDLIDSFQES